MEGDDKGFDDVGPYYWLDFFDDDNDYINSTGYLYEFANFVESIDGIDQSFFNGVDQIFDSIRNGDGFPCNDSNGSGNASGSGNGCGEIMASGELKIEDFLCDDFVGGSTLLSDEKMEDFFSIGSLCVNGVGVEDKGLVCDVKMENSVVGESLLLSDKKVDDVSSNGRKGSLCVNDGGVEDKGLVCDVEMEIDELGLLGVGEGSKGNGDRDSDEQNEKRACLSSGYRDESGSLSHEQSCVRVWESNERKRCRNFEETGKKKQGRKRDLSGRESEFYNGRREIRDREWRGRGAKGFWEREKHGLKEIVYRVGSYEAVGNKDMNKVESEKNLVSGGKVKKNETNKEKNLEERARQYQLEVLEQAKQKNTIAFLETGAGKTLIAVLLIKSIVNRLQQQNKKMLAVFLVPKVALVYQQAEVMREQTGFNVGHYCGEMGQDFLGTRRWQREFEAKQVLVMTAQILLNILRHCIIKMEYIDLLILDECHHAVKKHPYSLVMSEFYHKTPKDKRPAVFGMTASPVNLKGVSSQVDCAIKICNLEIMLDSIVCTIKDRRELEKYVPMPYEIVVEYDKAASFLDLHEQIKQMEEAVEEAARASSRKSKWQLMGARDAGAKEELHRTYGVSERTESDGAANLIKKLRAVNYALSEMGQWCAYKVALNFLVALQSDERAYYQLDVKFQESYLSKVVALLQCQLSEGAASNKEEDSGCHQDNGISDEIEEGELPDCHVVSGGEHVDVIIGAAVADGKVTPKVQSLIKVLMKYQHTDDFRAIIFVERVVAALVLPKIFAELPSLSFIKCASLIGHNNSKEMQTSQTLDTIAKFRDGRVTVLVATSVAEEGLDIRQCNVVIRFDLAKTILAFIQSRGRARKPGSDYILMVERGNSSHEAFLKNAKNSEETLLKEAIERTDVSFLKGSSRLISAEISPGSVYQVASTGATVSLNSAVGLIHFYCSRLPSDRYSILRPEFIMERHEKSGGCTEYFCRLQLPCNAPFERLEGPVCSSMHLAQQTVCLAACKKLHEMGVFTDMLLPDKGCSEEGDKIEPTDEGEPLPGTTRYREFYPEGIASILQGEWILSGRDACNDAKVFHLYMYAVKWEHIGSSKDHFVTQVSDFSVLFGCELDSEVLSAPMDLFIARNIKSKASLVFQGLVNITESQLSLLKSFHVRMMSIILDVNIEPSTTPWDPAKAYLFVPMANNKSLDILKDIDWDLIEILTRTDAWKNPLQRARPDVYLGTSTKERSLVANKKECEFGKLRYGLSFGQKRHPTYGIRGAVAEYDVVKAFGLVLDRNYSSDTNLELPKGYLMLADSYISAEELVGKIVTAAHSGKRFYVDSVCYEMTANNSFPRKEGFFGLVEYSSYADYYKKKYGVELVYKEQPLLRGRAVSHCKNLLSPRFKHVEGEHEETFYKTYYVFLPAELCFVHPLPGVLVRGAQRLPSVMRRVESMLLAIELKNIINYPIPASKILEALTAASCQEAFCYERVELLGDSYLKWVVSTFLFHKYPQKHEGQLTLMRQKMVSNMALYHRALEKGLQLYIQADLFAPSRWAAPGVLPVFDEDIEEDKSSLFDQEIMNAKIDPQNLNIYDDDDDEMEDGKLASDSSSYRVLSSKTLADVVEALIGVYYVEGGKLAANHFLKWIGIDIEFNPKDIEHPKRPRIVPEGVLKTVDFDALEGALNITFEERTFLIEAITHASHPSSGVQSYQRLEFVGDAVLDHLITRHLFFTYTDLPPGRLTDLRAAAVSNENFARVAVKHKLHVHLRHGSTALEKQIRYFVKEVQDELSKPGYKFFGFGDYKAPKVLSDIVESIAGAIFLDSRHDIGVVWRVFEPLLEPIVTPDTLPMHPVRELQERCQKQAQGLEYKAKREGSIATVEVYVDGVQIAMAHNTQKKMAQKVAAQNALLVLKDKEIANAIDKDQESEKKKKNSDPFLRHKLNNICLSKKWPLPVYRCVHEGGPAHAKMFTFAIRVNTNDRGWTDECIGEPMPSVKKAKDSAAAVLLDLLNKE